MVRLPCCNESNVKRGPWTPDEDKLLVNYITKNGHGSWRLLSKKAGLNRCGKSCRLRWTNYLRPDIKRGRFDEEEEKLIIHFHSILGNKWSSIATKLPGRTDNEIKNYWNTHLRKKLLSMGIDPVTHKPHTLTASNLGTLVGTNQPIAMEFLRLQLVQILLRSMIATTQSLNPNMNLNSSLMGLNKDQPSNPINPSASITHEEWFNDSNSEYEQETSVKETETNDPFEALEDLNLDELSSDPYWKSII